MACETSAPRPGPLRRTLPIILAAAAAALACLTAHAQSFEGDWCGRSAQAEEVSFTVVGATVVEVDFRANGSSAGCFASAGVSGAVFAPIVDQSFTVSPPFVFGATLTLTGTFESTNDVAGTLTYEDTFCGFTVTTTWSALRGECRPAIVVDSPTRNFGEVALGSAATPRNVSVVNEGTADLVVTPIRLAGADGPQFSLPAETDGCSAAILAPAESCRFRLGFAPTDTGLKRALALIESNDPEAGEVRVQLRGIGVAAPTSTLAADPSRRNFGEVEVGTAAPPRRVTLTNHGRRSVRLAPIRIRGADRARFTLPAEEDDCSATALRPGRSCRFLVGFEPAVSGLQRALAVIASDDPEAGEIRILLRGTGVPAGLARTPDLVLANAEVLTLDRFDTVASAVRIRDGRIVAVGDVGPLGPAVEVIDLGGRTVIPGLVASGHGRQVADAESWRDGFALGLTSAAAATAQGPWVRIHRRFPDRLGAEGTAAGTTPADPWPAIQAAVSGKMDRLEALRLFTRVGRGGSGTIEVGRRADLAVLTDSYLAVPEEEIGALSSVLTLADGAVVFDRLTPVDHR